MVDSLTPNSEPTAVNLLPLHIFFFISILIHSSLSFVRIKCFCDYCSAHWSQAHMYNYIQNTQSDSMNKWTQVTVSAFWVTEQCGWSLRQIFLWKKQNLWLTIHRSSQTAISDRCNKIPNCAFRVILVQHWRYQWWTRLHVDALIYKGNSNRDSCFPKLRIYSLCFLAKTHHYI